MVMRYDLLFSDRSGGEIRAEADGDYVKYDDYAALQTELEQYKKALEIAGDWLSEGDCVATMVDTEKPEWCDPEKNDYVCDPAECWAKYCLSQAKEALK